MKVPFFSFVKMNADVKEQLLPAFEKFIGSEWYVLGEQVKDFEKDFAAYSGAAYCAGVANGLDALIIALKTLGIGPGDEVIVPSNTYIASWLAVSYVGANPVPVEPRIETYNINPELISEKITTKTKAVMPVHLYGQACEMEAIMQIAEQHGLFVVEDNAQAQGATYKGKRTGSYGHISGTSFYPAKNIGAYGDAGAVTTNDHTLYEKANTIRNYGSSRKYYNEIKGINSRLDEMQAGFLSIKLKYLDQWNRERQQVAAAYYSALAGVGDLLLPRLSEGATSVFHQFVIRTKRRDELQAFLTAKEIGTLIHYPLPPHLQQAYSELGYSKGDFPLAEEIASTCLSLPVYPGLTETIILQITQAIEEFYRA